MSDETLRSAGAAGDPGINKRRGMADNWELTDGVVQPKAPITVRAHGFNAAPRGRERDLPSSGRSQITNDHPTMGGPK
jgi:hypothetical protein